MSERGGQAQVPTHARATLQAATAPLKWLFGDTEPEIVTFETGDDIIREGSALEDPFGLLVVDGELEERMMVYVPGQGLIEQPLFLACSGDLVNIQALIPTYREQPALCSLHAVSDGWAAKVFPEKLPPSAGLLDTMFLKTAEALERERQMVGLYGSVVTLFQNAPDAIPFVPADPQQLMQRLLRALEERGYLSQSSRSTLSVSSADRVRVLEDQNRRLKEKLDRTTKRLSAAISQCRSLEQKCEFEGRARAALEQRMSEMMQQMVERSGNDELFERFPNTVTVLESTEIEALERAARQQQKRADQFKRRAIKLHRAIELIERDNPAMSIAEDVMLLMLGEDPPERDGESDPRQTMPMVLNPSISQPSLPEQGEKVSAPPISCPVPSSRHVESCDPDDIDADEFDDLDLMED